MIITDFDQAHFLNEYWQKKPCIIRGFIDSFTDPIDEHELAGLAQEDEIDSRVVSCINGQWSAYQGPFDTFDEICTGAWSLLVQGVDRYIDDIDELTQLVNFIPKVQVLAHTPMNMTYLLYKAKVQDVGKWVYQAITRSQSLTLC
jgi:50S ribosomal protein L16 3-hydroxylase